MLEVLVSELVLLCAFSTWKPGIIIQAIIPSGLIAGGSSNREKRKGKNGVQSSNYWTGSTNANNTDNAWNINLNNGNVNNNTKTNENFVWPVWGGE